MEWLRIVSGAAIALGLASSFMVMLDLRTRRPQPMTIMNFVWPVNALWGGPVILWAYYQIGRAEARSAAAMAVSMPAWVR